MNGRPDNAAGHNGSAEAQGSHDEYARGTRGAREDHAPGRTGVGHKVPLAPLLIAFYAAWTAWSVVGFPAMSAAVASPWVERGVSAIVALVVWVLPAWVVLRRAGCQRPGRFLRLTSRPAPRPTLVVLAALPVWLGAAQLATGRSVADLHPAQLAGTLTAPVVEEVLFRGLVLGVLAARMGFWRANVTAALLFVVPHLPFWLYVAGPDSTLLLRAGGVALLGIGMGVLLRWTRSLWPPMAAHYVNNVAALLAG